MPRKYGFQSGEVFDTDDKQSGQVDVIIYDNLFSTVFTDGTDKILAPVESTFGIISIKSKMGTRELDDAIAGIKNFESLRRTPPLQNAFYIMPDLPLVSSASISFGQSHQRNINFIFAYDTTVALQTIKERVKIAGCIDLLVVPGQICLIGRQRVECGFSMNGGALSNAVIINKDHAISLFIILLQLYLSQNHLVAREIKSLALWIMKQSQVAN